MGNAPVLLKRNFIISPRGFAVLLGVNMAFRVLGDITQFSVVEL
jgi:hypothetical protein